MDDDDIVPPPPRDERDTRTLPAELARRFVGSDTEPLSIAEAAAIVEAVNALCAERQPDAARLLVWGAQLGASGYSASARLSWGGIRVRLELHGHGCHAHVEARDAPFKDAKDIEAFIALTATPIQTCLLVYDLADFLNDAQPPFSSLPAEWRRQPVVDVGCYMSLILEMSGNPPRVSRALLREDIHRD